MSETRNGLRRYLRSLSRRRLVTADDAQSYLTRQGVRRINSRLSLINSVLREPEFEAVGSQASARPAARYRQVTTWQLA